MTIFDGRCEVCGKYLSLQDEQIFADGKLYCISCFKKIRGSETES